ncbi:magnesium transporter MRS2-1-like [Iris pallida]|uniref:Magnesium transporter MRS2-1-like n=1 Tax=Iris pallida TaxID=29817 RepID=A0AAX6I0Q0_IRIPA|nr:magnesium transporter MRS2-1-like [Iris pallida]
MCLLEFVWLYDDITLHERHQKILRCLLSWAAELEIEAYPLLDELTSKISTLNLERVRRSKSRLVALIDEFKR